MSQRLTITSRRRELTGKKVKHLRSEGGLPANIYGPNTDSVPITLDQLELRDVLKKAGETQLIDLSVEGEDAPRTVLISDVQRHHISGKPIHIDFYQVDMTEKIEVAVPLEIDTDEAPALKEHVGLVIQRLEEITIRILPDEIPEDIKVDVSEMKEVGDAVYVRDLNAVQQYEVVTDPDLMVLAVVEEETEEEVEVESVASELPEIVGEDEEEAVGEEASGKESVEPSIE